MDSDLCWWCGSARQTREHLFKECITWKEEIRELWKEIGEIWGERRTRGNVLARVYFTREERAFSWEDYRDRARGERTGKYVD